MSDMVIFDILWGMFALLLGAVWIVLGVGLAIWLIRLPFVLLSRWARGPR